jgi:hypothetical protein
MKEDTGSRDDQLLRVLWVAAQDLELAKEYAQTILKQRWHHQFFEVRRSTYIRQSAFTSALVLAYCRPFTQSRGFPCVPERVLAMNSSDKALHKIILKLRNKFHAHSEVDVAVPHVRRVDSLALPVIIPYSLYLGRTDVSELQDLILRHLVSIRRRIASLQLPPGSLG